MNLSEVRKVVGTLKQSFFRSSNNKMVGLLKSNIRGSGIQFKEHRQYMAGDEVRFIDWKLLARKGVPHIRTYEEERNVKICVVIDAGRTMFSGVDGISKIQVAIELTALLILLAQKTNDYIFPIIVADNIYHLPRCVGEKGLVQFLSEGQKIGLFTLDGKVNLKFQEKYYKNESNLGDLKKDLMSKQRSTEMIIFSDFKDIVSISLANDMIKRKHVHCYRLRGPSDYENKIRILAKGLNKRNKFLKTYTTQKEEEEEKNVPWLLDIDLQDNYVEKFAKGMI